MHLKSIVFDLDGTLIDSPLCFVSIKKALSIPDGSYILEHLATLPPDLRSEKELILEQMEVEAAKSATLHQGVLELFTLIKSLKLKSGIFTRNCRAVAKVIQDKFLLPVDVTITREDAPAKPDPTALLTLLRSWNHTPLEMLYIGDYKFDIDCGKRAGVKTALFTAGTLHSDDYGADMIINNYNDFIQLLKHRATPSP